MYQVIVKRGDLEPALAAVAASEPEVLPAWDPMGALALARAAEY
jgi:aminopeptidase C